MIFANLLKKHLFWVFIRDVSDHESRPSIELDLSNAKNTLSGIILYSLAYYPDTFLFLRFEICLW